MHKQLMHEKFLKQALTKAWCGRGFVAPNPAVGAVAVRGETVVASAFHEGVGHDHAEKRVLDELACDCEDITLYITLEPCNHFGRTPPCVDAIIANKVRRVVYAYQDPNPLVVSRNTPELLRAHGIEVIHYPMPEINAFYASYAHWIKTGRPWVTVKIAQSLDGKVAGKNSKRVQLSNATCDQFTQYSRQHTDVILTSTRTILIDNPYFTARYQDKVQQKPVAVIGHTKLEGDLNILSTAKALYTYQTHNLSDVLDSLGEAGFHDVWVEAGSQLFTALHTEKLVQTTHIYLTPKVLGQDAIDLYGTAELFCEAKKNTYEPMGDNCKLTLQWVGDI